MFPRVAQCWSIPWWPCALSDPSLLETITKVGLLSATGQSAHQTPCLCGPSLHRQARFPLPKAALQLLCERTLCGAIPELFKVANMSTRSSCGAFLPANSTNLVQPAGSAMTWGLLQPSAIACRVGRQSSVVQGAPSEGARFRALHHDGVSDGSDFFRPVG
jgi:hypothetical protein